METDTVAHCGGSLSGEFITSVTMVDICTLWTEVRAVYGKGSNAVFDAIKDIELNLPFKIVGYDADNGGEVLNKQLFNYFVTERIQKGIAPVQVTRSRAYKKNDNCHVEQRNDSIARKYLGYNRIDFYQLVPFINHYYANLVCCMNNHFIPTFKLSDKIRVKSKTIRVYKTPITPYQRVMDSLNIPQNKKDKLKQIHLTLNPVELSRKIDAARNFIDQAIIILRQNGTLPTSTPSYQLKDSLISSNIVPDFQVFHYSMLQKLS